MKRTTKITLVLLLLLAVAITPASLFAQDEIKITWGKENPTTKRATYMSLGESSEGNIYALRTDKRGRKFLEKFDKDGFGLKKSKEVDFQLSKKSKSKKKRLDFENAFIMEDGIIIFASKYDKQTDQFGLYARTFDLDAKPLEGWVRLESIYARKKKFAGEYQISRSKDRSKLLIKHKMDEGKEDDPIKLSLKSYNSKLGEIGKKTIVFEKASNTDNIEIFGQKITNSGDVYFLTKYIEQLTVLYKVPNTNADELEIKDLIKYDWNIKNKRVVEKDVAWFEDNGGNIVLAGFYCDDITGDYCAIKGVFYIKLEKQDLKPVLVSANPFSQEFLDTYFPSFFRKSRGASTTFDLRQLVFTDEGDATLVAEQFYIEERCQSSSPGGGAGISVSVTTCRYYYHYNSLLLVGINADGEVRHTTFLPKSSVSIDPNNGFQSFGLLPSGKDILIFHNDHYKNHKDGNLVKRKGLPKEKKMVLVKVHVSFTGEVQREVLFRNKEEKVSAQPRYAVRSYDGTGLVILGYYKKRIKFGKFEIDTKK